MKNFNHSLLTSSSTSTSCTTRNYAHGSKSTITLLSQSGLVSTNNNQNKSTIRRFFSSPSSSFKYAKNDKILNSTRSIMLLLPHNGNSFKQVESSINSSSTLFTSTSTSHRNNSSSSNSNSSNKNDDDNSSSKIMAGARARMYLQNWVGAKTSIMTTHTSNNSKNDTINHINDISLSSHTNHNHIHHHPTINTINTSATSNIHNHIPISNNDANFNNMHNPNFTNHNHSINHHNMNPLYITKSTYLLPTLRLDRTETPATLNAHPSLSKIQQQIDPNNTTHAHTHTHTIHIILDLSHFRPDGSPHYKPPPIGTLEGFVNVLNSRGIHVLAVSNITGDYYCANLEHEAKHMGLPIWVGRTGRSVIHNNKHKQNASSSSSSSSSSDHNVTLEDLIQLITTTTITTKQNDQDAIIKEEEEGEKIARESDNLSIQMNSNSNYNHNTITIKKEDIDQMPFRDLQKYCKELELGAKGTAIHLKQKLYSYLAAPSSSNTHTIEATCDKHDRDPMSSDNSTSISTTTQYINDDKSNTVSKFPKQEETSSPSITTPVQIPPHTKVYTGTIRSGQQIASDEPHQSLIIIGNVNPGGEAMADGDLFVFGKLKGRALAGLASSSSVDQPKSSSSLSSSSTSSSDHIFMHCRNRIYANDFDPELICIGDTFTTVDSVHDLHIKGCSNGGVSSNSSSSVINGNIDSSKACMVSIDQQTGDLLFERIQL